MSDRSARGDEEKKPAEVEAAPRRTAADHRDNDPVFTYDEVAHAGATFGVSNETVAGALIAAGIPRTAHLSRKQVEEALKAFAKREVED